MATDPRDRLGTLLDGAAVVAVALVLVGVHVLVPAGVREGFALQFAEPDPFHALTAAYVHLGDAHLRANVVGLLAGGGWAILASRLAGEPRWFRFSLLWFLTALPIGVGLTGAWLVGGAATSRGFSAVGAGFAGFGLVGVAVVLERRFGAERWLARNVAAALTVALGAEVSWLVTGGISPLVGAVVAVGLGLTLLPVGLAGLRRGLPADRDGRGRWASAALVTALLSALVLVFVVALFPADFADGPAVTNVLGHYLGLVYGGVIAAWGYRYWSVEPPAGPGNRRS